jgi:Tfp pilus assembly protein PilO
VASPQPVSNFFKMPQISGRLRVALIFLFLIGYAAGFVFLVYQPYTKRVAELQARHVESERKLEAARSVLKRLDEINARIDELNRELESYNTMIPGDNRAAHFLYWCGWWERTTGARVQEMVFNPPTLQGEYQEFTVNFTVAGTYSDQVEFLAKIESMPRLVRVDSMSLVPEDLAAEGDSGGTDGAGALPGDGTGVVVATTDRTLARYVVHLFVDPSRADEAAAETPGAGLDLNLSEGRTTPFLP